MRDEIDLFGNAGTPPAGFLRPQAPPIAITLIDYIAERAAIASGRPLSQERIETGALRPEKD